MAFANYLREFIPGFYDIVAPLKPSAKSMISAMNSYFADLAMTAYNVKDDDEDGLNAQVDANKLDAADEVVMSVVRPALRRRPGQNKRNNSL